MRILSIGNFGTSWDGSICDEEHIAQALEGLGHEIDRQQREEISDGFIQDTDIDADYDFILIAQYDRYPSDLREVLRAFFDCPIVYWAFDYQEDGQYWHEHLVKTADLYLSKRVADSKYPNWQWLSQDFAPNFLDKYPDNVEQDIDVLFTGSYLSWAEDRIDILKAVDGKFNLHIYSFTPDAWKAEGFKNVFGPKMDDELPYLYARSKINLSIDHTIERGYWSDRNAQIMACGGFVMFKYVPMSEARFGYTINYFHTIDECLENIQYFLDVPEDRQLLAEMGYEYAQKHLDVSHRAHELITIVSEYLCRN